MNQEEIDLFKNRLIKQFGLEKKTLIEKVLKESRVPVEMEIQKERYTFILTEFRKVLKKVERNEPYVINSKIKKFNHVKGIINS